jgi:hypothetical protein
MNLPFYRRTLVSKVDIALIPSLFARRDMGAVRFPVLMNDDCRFIAATMENSISQNRRLVSKSVHAMNADLRPATAPRPRIIMHRCAQGFGRAADSIRHKSTRASFRADRLLPHTLAYGKAKRAYTW